jgi:MFS family permease
MALATPTELTGEGGSPPPAGALGGGQAGGPADGSAEAQRTGIHLPWRQLFVMSVYWFGIQAIWGGYETFGQEQVKLMVGEESKGLTIGIIESLGALMALVVQPTAGVISDYTSTRWGRRKAYILVGSVMDVIFLAGLALIAIPSPGEGWDGQALATTQTVVLYLGLYLCLQFSSNMAQGPFQGYLPDLVPEHQVGAASTLVGIMKPLGLIGGALVMITLGIGFGLWGLALILIGLIELTLATITFFYVQEGPTGKPRNGRSWWSIGTEAWGMDVVKERSFLLMTTVRFLVLMGTGIFFNVQLYYLEALGYAGEDRTPWAFAGSVLGVTTAVIAAAIATPLSDRTGRKPIIWVAIAIAATGIAVLAAATDVSIALVGVALMGFGTGAYLAVDWALMTEVIPLASSGRFMGLANVANSLATPVGLVFAGITIDYFTRTGNIDLGPRAGVALGIPMLIGAGIILVGVRPRRDPRLAAAAA